MKRIGILSIAAVLLPIALGAQQPRANPITRTFLSFGYYGSWLVAAFDSIPAGRYDFKPAPPQQSVGYIAQHLEDANYQLCERIGGVKRAMTPRDSLADTVKARWPKDTLVARLRASLVFCQRVVERLDDARLVDEVPVGAPGSGQTAPRVRFLILLVTDLAEHYAQLASYMRILGMTPPSALP